MTDPAVTRSAIAHRVSAAISRILPSPTSARQRGQRPAQRLRVPSPGPDRLKRYAGSGSRGTRSGRGMS